MKTTEFSKWMIIGGQILIESDNVRVVTILSSNSVMVTTKDGDIQVTKPFASEEDALACLRHAQNALSLIELEGKRGR